MTLARSNTTRALANSSNASDRPEAPMPIKSPTKVVASPPPKPHNLLEACRASCHASAAAICNHLSRATGPQRALAYTSADASGWTPLLYAARNGWPDIVEQCLAAGQSSSPHTARLQSSGNTGTGLPPCCCLVIDWNWIICFE